MLFDYIYKLIGKTIRNTHYFIAYVSLKFLPERMEGIVFVL